MGKRAEQLQSEVLTLLKAQPTPLSAYGILAALEREDRRLAPTTIYRALSALVATGRIHRLESQNAFVACRCEVSAKTAILSICDHCGRVEEIVSADVLAALSSAAGEAGFSPSRHVIEVIGQCAACFEARQPPRQPPRQPQ